MLTMKINESLFILIVVVYGFVDETICSDLLDDEIEDLESELMTLQISLAYTREAILDLSEMEKWKGQTIRTLKRSNDMINEIQGNSEVRDYSEHVVRRSTDQCTSHEHLRLVNGSSDYEGRLEVLVGDVWMNVCEDGWSKESARLVCSMLGHPGLQAAATGSYVFGNGNAPMLPGVSSCTNSGGVICGDFDNYPVRLVNGSHPNEGRVEIQLAGEWGTICHYSWNIQSAQVVCKMLGYSGDDVVPTGGAFFGEGKGHSWMYYTSCQGSETHILLCGEKYHPPGYRSECSHSYDVGVICGELHFYPVRLVNGSTEHEGRVEIRLQGRWTSIYDGSWDDSDAQVVCRMLGYSSPGAKAVLNSYFGAGTGVQILTYVYCQGNEQHILMCPNGLLGANIYSYHQDDAGVICQP